MWLVSLMVDRLPGDGSEIPAKAAVTAASRVSGSSEFSCPYIPATAPSCTQHDPVCVLVTQHFHGFRWDRVMGSC